MRVQPRQFAFASGILLLLCGIGGCQYSYPFDLRGEVKDSADGTPLAGVRVRLTGSGISNNFPSPLVTGENGTFHATFRVGDIEFIHAEMPRWSVVLSRAGYHDETIDISPKQRPESPKNTTLIVIKSHMRSK